MSLDEPGPRCVQETDVRSELIRLVENAPADGGGDDDDKYGSDGFESDDEERGKRAGTESTIQTEVVTTVVTEPAPPPATTKEESASAPLTTRSDSRQPTHNLGKKSCVQNPLACVNRASLFIADVPCAT